MQSERVGCLWVWLVLFVFGNVVSAVAFCSAELSVTSEGPFNDWRLLLISIYLALHVAAVVGAILLLARKRVALSVLVWAHLLLSAVGVHQAAVIGGRGVAGAFAQILSLGFTVLVVECTNLWPGLLPPVESTPEPPRPRWRPLRILAIVMRGIGHALTALMLGIARTFLVTFKKICFIGFVGVLSYGVVVGTMNGVPEILAVVGITLVGGVGLIAALAVADFLGNPEGSAAVLRDRLFAFARASLTRPGKLATDDEHVRMLLQRGSPYTLLLRDWSSDARAVRDWFATIAATQPLVALMDPDDRDPEQGRLITPAASFFWWGETVRQLIRQAGSILVVGTRLTAGLRWELESIVAQGAAERALVLVLPTKDARYDEAFVAFAVAKFPWTMKFIPPMVSEGLRPIAEWEKLGIFIGADASGLGLSLRRWAEKPSEGAPGIARLMEERLRRAERMRTRRLAN